MPCSQNGQSEWEASEDQYPYGAAYSVGSSADFWPNYDGIFRFNAPLNVLAPTATALTVLQAAVPLTQTPVAQAQQTNIPLTATGNAISTRASILGLPPGIVARLEIFTPTSFLRTFQLQPGQSFQLIVGIEECCYLIKPVAVKTRWSISPAEGTKIDPDTGRLTIADTTPDGTVYTVTVTLGNGAHTLTARAYVYRELDNPLVGVWEEDAQFACQTGKEIQPDGKIGELVFRADGTFLLTWFPFEVYVDYGGTYRHDRKSGTLTLSPTWSNYLPGNTDLSGAARIDPEGRLVLSDRWLGTPPSDGSNTSSTRNCGHRFVRRASTRW